MLAAICREQGNPAGIVSLKALRELKTLLAETIAEQEELAGLKRRGATYCCPVGVCCLD